jgi:lipopolysaccharide heptosyltransferase II
MIDFFVYLCYRAILLLIVALPLRVVFSLGKIFGAVAWLVLPQYRRLARHNLRIAFGEEFSATKRRRIVRQHFQNLGANLLCGLKLNALAPEAAAEFVTTEGLDEIHRHLRAGRPVVLALSHLGNWELFAQLMPHFVSYAPLGTVYQKLRNRRVDDFVRKQRTRFGVTAFDRSEGFQEAIRLLRRGGLIGILCDQHAGDHGKWTPFFDRLASTTPLPAVLCKRTGAVLMAASIYTDGTARWRMRVTSAFDQPNDSIGSLTARANEVIADEIRRAPGDWFWIHNRWKTPNPNWLLAEYKRGIFLPGNGRKLQPFRILIRSSNWLGDSIISIPAVRAIKRGRPDAYITILAPEKIAAVWKLVAEVDDVMSLGNNSLGETRRVLRRTAPFDVGIAFPNSFRSALELWFAGIPRRVGYAGHQRRWLLNQIAPKISRPGPPLHQVEHYLDLAHSLGVKAAFEKIAIAPSVNREGQRVFGLCPGAEYGPAKRWLPERFAETAAAIGGHWILFGTAKDEAVGAPIAAALGENCTNLIGRTTLDELIENLRECEFLLTNDTGTMHLATLLDVPVLAVFGSTEPRLTGPLGEKDVVVRRQVECSPCFLRECPLDFRCMKAVTVEEVVTASAALA